MPISQTKITEQTGITSDICEFLRENNHHDLVFTDRDKVWRLLIKEFYMFSKSEISTGLKSFTAKQVDNLLK